jgi:hypothetical protein
VTGEASRHSHHPLASPLAAIAALGRFLPKPSVHWTRTSKAIGLYPTETCMLQFSVQHLWRYAFNIDVLAPLVGDVRVSWHGPRMKESGVAQRMHFHEHQTPIPTFAIERHRSWTEVRRDNAATTTGKEPNP